MVCFDTGYEVVTDTVTLLADNGSIGRQEFRIAAPTGKVPLSGGYASTTVPVRVDASYPDGDDWVFEFVNGDNANHLVDIYLVAAYQ